jgi:O-acetylhomoserine/O-acetylserine sulfhydrylase-like pyridoxal-dependent enzyme
MNLIKYSEDTDIMFVLNKLLTNKVFKLNMCYVDFNYGSIFTFAIKYSQEFAKKLINNPFINEVLNDKQFT